MRCHMEEEEERSEFLSFISSLFTISNHHLLFTKIGKTALTLLTFIYFFISKLLLCCI